MPLLIVRHAHAGSRSAWAGDDRRRPLSAKGQGQARALVPVLSAFGPTRCLSSPYLRCMETVEPAATASSLATEPIEELAEGRGPDAVALIDRLMGWPVDGPLGHAIVLCTHGDVAVDVFDAFGPGGKKGNGKGKGPDPGSTSLQKGALWVLERTDGTIRIVDHLRPPVVLR